MSTPQQHPSAAETRPKVDPDPSPAPPAQAAPLSRARGRYLAIAEGLTLALVIAGAAALRLVDLKAVAADPYYDSAVRSMGLSWHNFLFGALEPGASVSLDKPPLDLWPAVLASKLFGFGPVTIRLPEALAGVAAVALLYLAVRRPFGARAAIGAAAALAVLPVEVISSRSDTTDAIMMALLTLALYLVVLAIQSGRGRWLLLAAAVLGVAFNVKLAETWLALPPLALIAWLGLPRGEIAEAGSRAASLARAAAAGARVPGRSRSPTSPRRARSPAILLLAAAAIYLGVALSWLTLTLVVPTGKQPYAIGSTNGSPWNAAFVFNGVDRLHGSQQLEGAAGSFNSHRHYPQATQAERDGIPIPTPSTTRLLSRIGPLSGERLGLEALVALLLGLPALVSAWRERRGRPPPADSQPREEPTLRVRRAVLAGLALWLLEGIVLFSVIARLHPRYTEAFTPAVAGMLGIGVIWATERRTVARSAMLWLTAVVVVLYTEHLLYGTPAIWWVTLAAAAGTLVLAALPRTRPAAFLPLLCCVLAIPLWASLNAVRENVSDGNVLGFLPTSELDRLSSYLRAHQGTARYEAAYDAATKMGALVMRDARPVLPLTTVEGRQVIAPARLRTLAQAGQVRYAFLPSSCPPGGAATDADCSAPAAWIREHGTDVSSQASLRPGTLWELPGPRAAR